MRAPASPRTGGTVVVEEFLDGPEVSLFVLCDGETVVPLAPAQDFKRVGRRRPRPQHRRHGRLLAARLGAGVDGRRARHPRGAADRRRDGAAAGRRSPGSCSSGSRSPRRGPRVIEFNARFGDPETQVVLARLQTPLGGLLMAAATGRPRRRGRRCTGPDQHAVTVVVASHNYPGTPRTGDPVTGIEEATDVPTAYVLHAGTARDDDGTLVSAGGRVLSVVALGDSLSQARERAYAAVDAIELEGSHHRTDIALAAERNELHVG